MRELLDHLLKNGYGSKTCHRFFVHQQDVAMSRYVHTPIQMVPLVSTLSHHPNK
jgi:hypothetical protein